MPLKQSPDARFHAEMLALYDRCAQLGFRPVMLRRLVVLKGGVEAARQLISQPGSTGLELLMAKNRADLSMEAMMLRPEFRPLFSLTEISEATRRLSDVTPRQRSRGRLTATPTTPKAE